MSVFSNPDNMDIFGNERHDIFGNHDPADVLGNPPMEVWGNHVGAIDDHHRFEDHTACPEPLDNQIGSSFHSDQSV